MVVGNLLITSSIICARHKAPCIMHLLGLFEDGFTLACFVEDIKHLFYATTQIVFPHVQGPNDFSNIL
jgi:hypothetical protein